MEISWNGRAISAGPVNLHKLADPTRCGMFFLWLKDDFQQATAEFPAISHKAKKEFSLAVTCVETPHIDYTGEL